MKKRNRILLAVIFVLLVCLAGIVVRLARDRIFPRGLAIGELQLFSDNGEPVREFRSSPEDSLILFLDRHDFFPGEEADLGITLLWDDTVTEEIFVYDQESSVICTVENDGSGRASLTVPFLAEKEGTGGLYAVSGETESETAVYYVTEAVTEEQADTLEAICQELCGEMEEAAYEDPCSTKAVEHAQSWLEADDRVESVGINNGAVLFRTTDGLMGSYWPQEWDPEDPCAGYSPVTEAYEDWQAQEDVSDYTVESRLSITNDEVLMLVPDYMDETLWRDNAKIFSDILGELESRAGMRLESAFGIEAQQAIGSADFTDCGLLMLCAHGSQLIRQDGSYMVFTNLGQVTEENMLALMNDSSRLNYNFLWGERVTDEEDYVVAPDRYRMVYSVENQPDGSFRYTIRVSTNFYESVLRSELFDNTAVLFAVCMGYSDMKLVKLFLNHGANAFLSCKTTYKLGSIYMTLSGLADMIEEKDGEGRYLDLSECVNRINRCEVDNIAGFQEETWEEIKKATAASQVSAGGTDGFVLKGEGRLEGRVVSSTGDGIPGVSVTVFRWLNHEFTQTAQMMTDEEGNYSAEVPFGVYAVKAEKAFEEAGITLTGSATVSMKNGEETMEDITLPVSQFIGYVKDADTNAPIEGASILYTLGETSYTTVTDENGMFTAAALAEGDYTVTASAKGYKKSAPVVFRLAMDTTAVLMDDILLEPGSQITAVAAGRFHIAALFEDGTVEGFGNNDDNQLSVFNWTDITSVACGAFTTVGLKADGTVVAAGFKSNGACDVENWSDITAIAAGTDFTLGLKSDGTVVATGKNDYGQCDVESWTDIVAISAGNNHSVGLKSDGSVVAVGRNNFHQCNVGHIRGAMGIAAEYDSTLVLKTDGTVETVFDYGNIEGHDVVPTYDWTDIKDISANGAGTVIGLKTDGTVVAGSTSSTYDEWISESDSWTGITDIAAGSGFVVGLKEDGTVLAVGLSKTEREEFDAMGW